MEVKKKIKREFWNGSQFRKEDEDVFLDIFSLSKNGFWDSWVFNDEIEFNLEMVVDLMRVYEIIWGRKQGKKMRGLGCYQGVMRFKVSK